jgi:hypothetical protein
MGSVLRLHTLCWLDLESTKIFQGHGNTTTWPLAWAFTMVDFVDGGLDASKGVWPDLARGNGDTHAT